MSTVKKIEGMAMMTSMEDADPMSFVGTEKPTPVEGDQEWIWPNATLTIFDGPRKRLFTEDEVRAILHDMRDWIGPDDGEEGRVWETRAKRHGITLDPS